MCLPSETEEVFLKIPADLSHCKIAYWKMVKIDKCIAPIVEALQKGGIDMRGSCCGHGKGPGRIDLQDGRTIQISNGDHR